jgi:acyl-CoA synthetase (AMP-forming)/AMP-acid ligase II
VHESWGKDWVAAAQVGILDQENRLVPVGKIGEVCIRGPNVTKGYLNNPSANKEAYAGVHYSLCLLETCSQPR